MENDCEYIKNYCGVRGNNISECLGELYQCRKSTSKCVIGSECYHSKTDTQNKNPKLEAEGTIDYYGPDDPTGHYYYFKLPNGRIITIGFQSEEWDGNIHDGIPLLPKDKYRCKLSIEILDDKFQLGFDVRIMTCEDCPFKEYGLRKCGEIDRWFDDFEIENGIPYWCPKLDGEKKHGN
jgi:hypothetical protein